jgi:hypothetical protein
MLRSVLGAIWTWTGWPSRASVVPKVRYRKRHRIVREYTASTRSGSAKARAAKGRATHRSVAAASGGTTRRMVALSRVCRRSVPAWCRDGTQFGLFATKEIPRHTLLHCGATLNHRLESMGGYSSDGRHTGMLAGMIEQMSIVIGADGMCWDLRPERNGMPVARHLFYVNEACSQSTTERLRTSPETPNVRWHVRAIGSRCRLFVRAVRNIRPGEELLLKYNLDS